MQVQYNIFEVLPNGSVKWREDVCGLIKARRAIRELATTSTGEFFGMQIPERTVIFHSEGPALGRRVFQIAYTKDLGRQRAHVLRALGYGVLSVLGNSAAKRVLGTLRLHPEDVSVFLVGHAAPEPVRYELVSWLKARYPEVRTIVLNPPGQEIACADYNVLQNGPELWLPLMPSPPVSDAVL